MRATTLKLALALLALALVAGCSSTSTEGTATTNTAAPAATSSGVDDGSVHGGIVTKADGSVQIMSAGNIVYFDFDQDTIRPDAREVLMTHAARLVKSGEKAVLEGHADERGTREYNMALGERRGKAVRDFLVIQGVDRAKLEVVSYGEERPADPASNETAWAKNRRVIIK
jgi:peptidoglycan-associated lipoprotein